MLRTYYLYLFLLLFASGMSSCVSSRRYQEEVEAKNEAKADAAKSEAARLEAEKQLKTTQEELDEIKVDLAELREDHKLLQERYNQQQRLNKDLQESYDKLLALNEKLKDEAASRKRELSEELNIKRRELERKERELREAQERLDKAQARLDKEKAELEQIRKELAGKDANIEGLQGDLAKKMKQIEDLQAKLAERDAKTKELKDKLLAALKVFKDAGDLEVEIRDGKVYVSLSEKLLFKSGSSKVNPEGLSALTKVAEVLKKNKDLGILVEGHTDSDGDAKYNWGLSSDRALAVTQQLIKDGVDPARITAAGRGEHAPKASNDTKEGKAKNRRTEIILEPQLDEIMGILND
jgi:chemotaxis protein MotB